MSFMAGKQSVRFGKPVYVLGHACVGGKKEGDGPLGRYMDMIVEDPMFGKENWEEAESEFLKVAGEISIRKAKKSPKDIRMGFSGDLLGQMIASSFGMKELNIPFYGVYGACSSAGATISAAAMAVHGGFTNVALAGCSSHFASAEKEFRYPLGYGNQRPYSATWTVTGAGAYVLGNEEAMRKGGACSSADTPSVQKKAPAGKGREENAADRKTAMGRAYAQEGKGKTKDSTMLEKSNAAVIVRGFTTGIIKDYGVSDVFNMGACMAPAAADTIYQALKDFSMKPEDFDCIATGDLGAVGQKLLFSLLEKNHMDISGNHIDCGMQIYDEEKQDTHAGGSGCACSAMVLSAMILPRLKSGEWKKVLFVPTGALLSQVSANEGRTIPSIAHAVWLEHGEL